MSPHQGYLRAEFKGGVTNEILCGGGKCRSCPLVRFMVLMLFLSPALEEAHPQTPATRDMFLFSRVTKSPKQKKLPAFHDSILECQKLNWNWPKSACSLQRQRNNSGQLEVCKVIPVSAEFVTKFAFYVD